MSIQEVHTVREPFPVKGEPLDTVEDVRDAVFLIQRGEQDRQARQRRIRHFSPRKRVWRGGRTGRERKRNAGRAPARSTVGAYRPLPLFAWLPQWNPPPSSDPHSY